MKRLRKIPAFLCSLLILALVVPATAPCSTPMPEKEAAAKAVNAFGIDLYRQIRKPEGNLIFSPYSISACLAMAYAGARGNTESQMAKALHFNLGQPEVSEAFRALSGQVLAAGQGEGAELNIANALWAEKAYTLKQEFLESIRINYHGGLRQLDFRQGADSARQTINSWVEEQTKDKIKDLLAPGMITSDTRLVLTNAIYFKGTWQSQFKKRLTKDDPFTLLDGKEIKVPMMHQTDSFGYVEETDLQVLEMPYKGRELSMVVLLPAKHKRLEDFEQSMTSEKLDNWFKDLRTRGVEVYLPRFKMTKDIQLKTALTRLGMADAFSPNADFSGMTGKRDLFISKAIHKAFVETNEEGTEAAAATGWGNLKGEPSWARGPIWVFRADHPFLFLIRHKPSNCILFFGRVTKP